MAKLRLVVALIAMTGCVHRDTTVDTMFPEPTEVGGPPGGDIDVSWQATGSPTSSGVVASVDPAAPDSVIGAVTDAEIDQTLEGYGEWIWVDEYGWVWRPYATEVGLDFTPYETCGSWVWTDDHGWVYGCDWELGWLPFHYGQWDWVDDSWAWVPDYDWSPAWVDWRGGGGYVGWAPSVPKVRDHRHHLHYPRDHRYGDGDTSTAQGGVVVGNRHRATQRDSFWRFATVDDFGKRNIRAHLFKHAAEGLRTTQIMPRPPIRGSVQAVSASSVMTDRLVQRQRAATVYTPSAAYITPRIRSSAPSIHEVPTAVEVPMENPPSIYAPGDQFREPTQSPIRSSSPPIDNSTTSSPLRNTPPMTSPLRSSLPANAATIQPQPSYQPPAWTPQPIQPQPQRMPPPSASTWTPPPAPVHSSPSHSPSNWGSMSSSHAPSSSGGERSHRR